MPLIYTTVDAIASELRYRLKIHDANTLGSVNPSTLAAQTVDPALIERKGTQVESRINSALRLIYQTVPIPEQYTEARAIIASIVEKFIVSEIAKVHYQGTQVAQLGGDNGFGAIVRKEAQEELQAIVGGHGIYIPGLMPPPSNVPGYSQQPVVLPDVPLQSTPADTLTKNYTVVGKVGGTLSTTEIDWGLNGSRSNHRNFGSHGC